MALLLQQSEREGAKRLWPSVPPGNRMISDRKQV